MGLAFPFPESMCQVLTASVDKKKGKGPSMEVLFILFMFISTSVLGILCLLVLEYQNGRARRLDRLWSERGSVSLSQPHPTPPDANSTFKIDHSTVAENTDGLGSAPLHRTLHRDRNRPLNQR